MTIGAKHLFGSIDDTRVTFVEKGVNEDRRDFLKKLMEHNGFEVLTQEDKKENGRGSSIVYRRGDRYGF